ncbi:MAG: hypothetical protein PHY92_00050 [Alphaproteobacteria bacterium]|nr:hypothetical protein [Alphaproteobacteria bacterium]
MTLWGKAGFFVATKLSKSGLIKALFFIASAFVCSTKAKLLSLAGVVEGISEKGRSPKRPGQQRRANIGPPALRR